MCITVHMKGQMKYLVSCFSLCCYCCFCMGRGELFITSAKDVMFFANVGLFVSLLSVSNITQNC